MIRYQRNNIIFRIASSDAISKFKSQQAQSFVQLARKEFNFSESAREVVLLEFDHLSQWIFRVERICLSAQEGMMPEVLRAAFQDSFDEEIKTIETVLESHPDVFNSTTVQFVKLIHRYSLDVTRTRMEQCMHEMIDRAFERLVGIVAEYLEHILICMHELNNNYLQKAKSNQPFICLTNFIVRRGQADMFVPFIMRAKFFTNLGIITPFVLKNYSDFKYDTIYDSARDYAREQCINIIEDTHEEYVETEAVYA